MFGDIDSICAIRDAKLEVDGDLKDCSYIETTGGFHFYCLETIETIEETLIIIS